jgi:TRAP-type C4-dicarboxylate transport system permease small subunit
MGKLLKRIDDAWYRVERALCIALLAVMALVVFFDAVHRQAATEGRLEVLCRRLFGEANAALSSTLIAFALAWLVLYGALRTAKRATPLSAPLAAGVAVVGVGAGWGLVRALVAAFPNGLIWAQSMGLSGMLWVGFLGASMATKEGNHLTLEITEIIWKGKMKAHVGRLGALAAAAFCAVIGWLCLRQVLIEHAEWAETEGTAAVMIGFEVPRFAVFSILPFTFAVMTLRFVARALGPTEPEKAPDLKPIAEAAEPK